MITHYIKLGAVITRRAKYSVLGAAFLALSASPAFAVLHGPVCQWIDDPTTTMTVRWLTQGEAIAAPAGTWQSGRAGFGYGDDDDQTVLSGMRGAYRSVYLTRAYAIPKDAPREAELTLEIRYDDGFIAYLDGREVVRQGVKGRDQSLQEVVNHEADKWERFSLGTAVPGSSGIVALEGHNRELDSSDFTLDPRITLRKGDQVISVVEQQAVWHYLAGAHPRDGWTGRLPKPAADSPPADDAPVFAYRAEKDTTWKEAAISTHPFGATPGRVHGVGLTGLTPGTRYEFRITAGGQTVDRATFDTAPATFVPGLSFVTGGDMFHNRKLLDAMNARAGAEAPLFALLGGDLAYANGGSSQRWFEWFDSWRELAVTPDGELIPMIVAIGNHEVKGMAYRPVDPPSRDQSPYYYTAFAGQENGARTAVDFADYLSIVTVDSGHTASIASQTDWVDRTLAARAHIPRLFVCYHRPAWGTGVKKDAEDIQREWSPLFEQHRVDAVFENDHHVYKRTHPIANGQIDHLHGVPYMGDGSWGVNLRKLPSNWKSTRPWLAEAISVNHLIKVTLGKDALRFEAMDAEGTVFDQVTRPVRRR